MKSCIGSYINEAFTKHFIAGDSERIEHLLATYPLVAELLQQATCTDAEQLINTLRSRKTRRTAIEALVADYNLAEREGIVMMSLAEAVIRTPDSATRTRLVRDKIANLDTPTPEGGLLRRASHWGLVLAGKVVDDLSENDAKNHLERHDQSVGHASSRQSCGDGNLCTRTNLCHCSGH